MIRAAGYPRRVRTSVPVLLGLAFAACGKPAPAIPRDLGTPRTCDDVVIYSAPGCVACTWAKDHAARRGVKNVVVRDVSEDAAAERFVRARNGGHIVVPVVDVCGELEDGYSPERFDRALARAH